MTGALARTGERMTMDVTQGNDGNGHSIAAITPVSYTHLTLPTILLV